MEVCIHAKTFFTCMNGTHTVMHRYGVWYGSATHPCNTLTCCYGSVMEVVWKFVMKVCYGSLLWKFVMEVCYGSATHPCNTLTCCYGSLLWRWYGSLVWSLLWKFVMEVVWKFVMEVCYGNGTEIWYGSATHPCNTLSCTYISETQHLTGRKTTFGGIHCSSGMKRTLLTPCMQSE